MSCLIWIYIVCKFSYFHFFVLSFMCMTYLQDDQKGRLLHSGNTYLPSHRGKGVAGVSSERKEFYLRLYRKDFFFLLMCMQT